MPPTSSPPFVVSIERAWRDLMHTLGAKVPGKVNEARIITRVHNDLLRGR
jgi:hypothetical protein